MVEERGEAMSEELQITEAWKTYSVIRDTGETPEETFENGARSGIEIGLQFLNLLCKEGRCPEFFHKSDDNLATVGIQCVQLSVYDGGERVHFYGDDAAAALRQCAERLYREEG